MILKLATLAVVIIVAIIGVSIWRKDNSMSHYQDDHLSFNYPKEYIQQATRKSEPHAKNLLRAVLTSPLSVIELNKETGAIIGANVTKTPFLEYLERNAGNNLPRTYPNYQKVALERIKITGRDVSLTKFSYTGKDKQTVVFTNLYIITTGNDAYYLYVQSTDKDRWQNDTKKVQSSLKIF